MFKLTSKEQENLIRKIVSEWDDYDLKEIILSQFNRTSDMVNYIFDEGLLYNDYDDILFEYIKYNPEAYEEYIEHIKRQPHPDQIPFDYDTNKDSN